MAAEYRDKWTLITTVPGQYLSFATFPIPLLSHYPLPLTVKFVLEIWKDKFEASKVQFTYDIVS